MSDRLYFEASRGSLSSSLRRGTADFLHWISSVSRWSETRRVRLHLARLDDHMLADIGLTREHVMRDAGKWPWEA
jgi:uncharacterized protein YjiS (DUF1127 family)